MKWTTQYFILQLLLSSSENISMKVQSLRLNFSNSLLRKSYNMSLQFNIELNIMRLETVSFKQEQSEEKIPEGFWDTKCNCRNFMKIIWKLLVFYRKNFDFVCKSIFETYRAFIVSTYPIALLLWILNNNNNNNG